MIKLRPGRAGSNTAADHIEVLTEAIAQLPAPHRRRMLIICDSAGSTHALVEQGDPAPLPKVLPGRGRIGWMCRKIMRDAQPELRGLNYF